MQNELNGRWYYNYKPYKSVTNEWEPLEGCRMNISFDRHHIKIMKNILKLKTSCSRSLWNKMSQELCRTWLITIIKDQIWTYLITKISIVCFEVNDNKW